MAKIIDFNCTFQYSAGINENVTKKLDLKFPDAYMKRETMAKIALAIKEYDGATFCELPFCHTVEAESIGGLVNYGDEKAGPRAKEYICTKPEEILELKEIDFSTGRIYEVLEACRILVEKGENVVLDVAGPFTVMNVLIDPVHIFKAMRKKPELMKEVFWRLGNDVLKYIEEALKRGVTMISYADSSGGVNILGPKMAEQVVEDFTYEYLKRMQDLVQDKALVLLCPKTTFALLGTEKAEFTDVELPSSMRYSDACAFLVGKETFAGQMCIKNIKYELKSGIFKAVRLK